MSINYFKATGTIICANCLEGEMQLMPWALPSNLPQHQYQCNKCDHVVYIWAFGVYNEPFSPKELAMKKLKVKKSARDIILKDIESSENSLNVSGDIILSTPMGPQLASHRKKHGISVNDMAKKMKCAAQQIYSIERCKSPTIKTIGRYARILGLKVLVVLTPIVK